MLSFRPTATETLWDVFRADTLLGRLEWSEQPQYLPNADTPISLLEMEQIAAELRRRAYDYYYLHMNDKPDGHGQTRS